MAEQRSKCAFMAGPADAALKVSAAKWWFAISRDVLAKTYRTYDSGLRLPVTCHRTPTFTSPLRQTD